MDLCFNVNKSFDFFLVLLFIELNLPPILVIFKRSDKLFIVSDLLFMFEFFLLEYPSLNNCSSQSIYAISQFFLYFGKLLLFVGQLLVNFFSSIFEIEYVFLLNLRFLTYISEVLELRDWNSIG